MINSMTGFANVEHKTAFGTFIWDIRTVNHRYLESYFKLPDNLKSLEAKAREKVRMELERGKMEAQLQFRPAVDQNSIVINDDLAGRLAAAAARIRSLLGENGGAVDPVAILQMPGVMDSGADASELAGAAYEAFCQAVEQLKEARRREGDKLEKVLLEKLDAVETEVGKIRSGMPDVLAWQKNKLETALANLKSSLDPDRIEQEFIIIAQRLDIAEEIDRLTAHVSEVRSILKKGGSCGKKLDFMMQEFNRESNTIASKSINAGITASAVELKVLIEQMREQIQNIE